PLNVLAALLAAELAVPAAGLAGGAVNAFVIADRLPRAGAGGRLPRSGTVDGTVRSSNLSSVRRRGQDPAPHGRRFSWRPHGRWRNVLSLILLLLSEKESSPVPYHVPSPPGPDRGTPLVDGAFSSARETRYL